MHRLTVVKIDALAVVFLVKILSRENFCPNSNGLHRSRGAAQHTIEEFFMSLQKFVPTHRLILNKSAICLATLSALSVLTASAIAADKLVGGENVVSAVR